MNRRPRKGNKGDVLIDAEFRIKAEATIQKFCSSNDTKYTFPALLTNVERAFVHHLCPKFNLKSQSEGFGDNRRLSLFKMVEDENFVHQSTKLTLTSESRRLLKQHLTQHPKLSPADTITRKADLMNNFQPYALTKSPSVPKTVIQSNNAITKIRQSLSIYGYKNKIMQAIDNNRILLVQGR
jgi:hypothetical protein